MPSISHRASLGPGAPHRAKSGPAALPAGLLRRNIGLLVRWCAERFQTWRELRQLHELDEHLLRDIGLTAADVQSCTVFSRRGDRDAQDPKGPLP